MRNKKKVISENKIKMELSVFANELFIYIYISVMTTLGGIGMVMYMAILRYLVLAE